LGETVLDEFFIFFSNRGIFTPGALEEKLISIEAQLIEVVAFDVIEVRFLQIF
jgi:hypothetical protein